MNVHSENPVLNMKFLESGLMQEVEKQLSHFLVS